jgi:hypothetical protein
MTEQMKERKKSVRIEIKTHLGGTFAFGSHPETWVQICSALINQGFFLPTKPHVRHQNR